MDKMQPTHPKRSRLVTIIALMFLGWGCLVLVGVVFSRAWDPHSSFWQHSDAAWAREYVGDFPDLEKKRLQAAQHGAQMRYELPMKGVFIAWSLVTFVAAIGLLRRRNWARLVMIGAMVFAVVGIGWSVVLFTSLRMAGLSDMFEPALIAIALGAIAWTLRSPSIVREFRAVD